MYGAGNSENLNVGDFHVCQGLIFAYLSADLLTETITVENISKNFRILQDYIFIVGPLNFDLAHIISSQWAIKTVLCTVLRTI